VISPSLLQLAHDEPAAIRAELLAGLSAPTAVIAPKYLYDALGSRLFAAITELPEYYPTRTEATIFAEHQDSMAAALGPVRTLVDLGAGNCEKAARLFAALRVQRYVAVDISVDYLRESLQHLQQQYRAIEMLGIGLDFSSSLHLPAEAGAGPRTLFYPGSSIGNFTPAAALTFLRQAHAECRGGSLLIGVDLIKEIDILEAAYDDPLGVTAAFNRNLLLNLNRLAGTDFDLPTGAMSPFSTPPSHASRCTWKRCARRRCAGQAANGASQRPSACIPRIRTNGVARILPRCSQPPVFPRCATGAMRERLVCGVRGACVSQCRCPRHDRKR
jgi:L-histidine N-alpha-methyltransferase